MFALPEGPNGEHLDAVNARFHVSCDAALLDAAPLPNLRYVSQTREDCALYMHPANQRRRAEAKEASDTVNADDASDASDHAPLHADPPTDLR